MWVQYLFKCLQGGSWFCKHLYHCVIGLVIFALAFVQAIAGFVHHDWMRQAIIIISMINGGLGLLMASDATRSQQIAYDVVAAVVWAAMITVIVRVEKTKDLRSVTSWSATWLVSRQELLDRAIISVGVPWIRRWTK